MSEFSKLCQDLDLPFIDVFSQDWKYEVPIKYRTSEWLVKYLYAYLNNNYSTTQKQILMNLCLNICNDLLSENPNQSNPIFHQLLKVLYSHYQQHCQLIDYWAATNHPLDNCFALTQKIRELQQTYLINAKEWLALNQAEQDLLTAKNNFRQCPDFLVQLQIALNLSSQQVVALRLIGEEKLNDDQLSHLLPSIIAIALDSKNDNCILAQDILIKLKSNPYINQQIINLLNDYIDDHDQIIYRKIVQLLAILDYPDLTNRLMNCCKTSNKTEIVQIYNDFAKQIIKQSIPLSDNELNLIQNRCDRATPGPWQSYVEGRDHSSGSNFIMTGSEHQRGEDIELIGATNNDQDFIANARQDIPKLINEIKRLKKFIAQNMQPKK